MALDPKTHQYLIVGRTDVIVDSQDPEWVTQFTLEYRFEEKQEFLVRVYDKDGDDLNNLSKHQLCGELPFTMSSKIYLFIHLYAALIQIYCRSYER